MREEIKKEIRKERLHSCKPPWPYDHDPWMLVQQRNVRMRRQRIKNISLNELIECTDRKERIIFCNRLV